MSIARRLSLALCAICVLFAASVSVAQAVGPATVTVRVEGQNETLVPSTQVTTNTEPVVKDGKPEDSCPGTSALGALQLATTGNWSGKWFGGSVNGAGKFEGLGYAIETIADENHAFGSGAFWTLWINHESSEKGACEAEAENGMELLFYPCSETATECPSPLGAEAPASANVDESVTVNVKKYGPKGEASEVDGATVTGAAEEVKTGSNGTAMLRFTKTGKTTVSVSAPALVRTEATICVHDGNDGTCGTTAPTSGSPGKINEAPPKLVSPVPVADVDRIVGIADGRVFRHRAAPRLLRGTVTVPTGATLREVKISLKRTHNGRCFDFSGSKERFVRAKCGHQGPFFPVGGSESFSYLLPSRLPPGKYVYEVEAIDDAGQATKLVNGVSHVVFKVR